MKKELVDHTKELEQRISAIKINADDYCIFFNKRTGCLFPQKFCCYCSYAKFNDNTTTEGLCKFKNK